MRRLPTAAALAAFALMTPLAGCTTVPAATAPLGVSQEGVTIAARDGIADALLFTPQGSGKWPAVIVWTDGTGLRPAFADIGRKLAAEGFVVLVPNMFYRSAKLDGTIYNGSLTPDQQRERTTLWTGAISDDAVEADARAYMTFLDGRLQVDRTRKAGTIGFQYGAPYAFHTAFALPDRVGAVAVLHPFRIATTRDNSPHLFVNRSRAAYFVAIAEPDDAREPGDKDDLRKAFADAELEATVEVLPAKSGFAVPDQENYDTAAADFAWARVVALLKWELN